MAERKPRFDASRNCRPQLRRRCGTTRAPAHPGETLRGSLDASGNVKADTESYRRSIGNVFAAGEMRRGQSLVVRAIREGRQAARSIG